jgi:putative glutathione S-transferase
MSSAAPLTALAEVAPSGAFARSASPLVGRLGSPEFPAEGGGRYVLYVSYACPWACRVLAALALRGLEREVRVVACAPTWRATRPEDPNDGHHGWVFRARAAPGSFDAGLVDEVPEREPLFGAETVREVYERCAVPPEEGSRRIVKFTVPLLVDSLSRRAVCNESSLLLRDFGGTLFDTVARFPAVDLCPPALRDEIEAVSESFYGSINDGVYRCGFARSQAAYEAAAREALAGLRAVEARLARPGSGGFFVGARLTEADIRLFVTLVRWDPVYAVHFKTSFASVRASPVLLGFLRRVNGARSGAGGASVGEASVRLGHIKQHYFGSHEQLNPFGVVPLSHPEEGSELEVEAGAAP